MPSKRNHHKYWRSPPPRTNAWALAWWGSERRGWLNRRRMSWPDCRPLPSHHSLLHPFLDPAASIPRSTTCADAVSFLRTCLAQPRGGLIPTTFSRRPCPVLYTMWRWFKWAYIIAIFQSKNMSVQTMASTDNAIFGYPSLLLCSSFACSSLLKFHLETSQCSPL